MSSNGCRPCKGDSELNRITEEAMRAVGESHMSRGWARAALVGYRWFGAGIYPLLGPYLAIRAAKGKEDAAAATSAMAARGHPRPNGPLVWFHAASVGETTAVIPLINEVRRRITLSWS
jgi:hypothetical protein